MTRIERAIDIDRTPEEVFALLTDLDRLQEWATVAGDTRDVSSRPIRNGTTFTQVMRVLGRELETEWRVDELNAPHHVAYSATAPGGGELAMRQTVIAVDGRSRVELQIDYQLPGGFIGELIDRAYVEGHNEREAERSLQNLKGLLEHGRSAGAR